MVNIKTAIQMAEAIMIGVAGYLYFTSAIPAGLATVLGATFVIMFVGAGLSLVPQLLRAGLTITVTGFASFLALLGAIPLSGLLLIPVLFIMMMMVR